MNTRQDIPVVRPVQVNDDGRFLKWLGRAKEAAPSPPGGQGDGRGGDVSDIPEAIVVSHKGRQAAGGSQKMRTIGGDLPQPKVPEPRRVTEVETRAEDLPSALDTSRITSMEDYNEGRTKVAPLKRTVVRDGDRGLETPKFFDGKLPRSVERGVLHPQPGRLVWTAVMLLCAKLLTIAVVITLPILAIIDGRELIPKAMPLLVAFVVVGFLFISSANRARCRVCSCHFFYVRHCHKHKSSHKIPLVGRASTAALHLLLFKWMRCMYCGTAIRLRGSSGIGKPKKEAETDTADSE